MRHQRAMMLLLISMTAAAVLGTQDRSTVAAVLMGFLYRFWPQLRLPVRSSERVVIRVCTSAMTTRLL
jgi:hypothetical protein